MTRLLSIVVMLYAAAGFGSLVHANYDWRVRTCEPWLGVLPNVIGLPILTATWPLYWYQQIAHPSMNTWRCGDPVPTEPIQGTYLDNRPGCVSESKFHICVGQKP